MFDSFVWNINCWWLMIETSFVDYMVPIKFTGGILVRLKSCVEGSFLDLKGWSTGYIQRLGCVYGVHCDMVHTGSLAWRLCLALPLWLEAHLNLFYLFFCAILLLSLSKNVVSTAWVYNHQTMLLIQSSSAVAFVPGTARVRFQPCTYVRLHLLPVCEMEKA